MNEAPQFYDMKFQRDMLEIKVPAHLVVGKKHKTIKQLSEENKVLYNIGRVISGYQIIHLDADEEGERRIKKAVLRIVNDTGRGGDQGAEQQPARGES